MPGFQHAIEPRLAFAASARYSPFSHDRLFHPFAVEVSAYCCSFSHAPWPAHLAVDCCVEPDAAFSAYCCAFSRDLSHSNLANSADSNYCCCAEPLGVAFSAYCSSFVRGLDSQIAFCLDQ